MRLSLGSVGALVTGVLIGYAFWPNNLPVPGPERAAAQEMPKAKTPRVDTSPSEKSRNPLRRSSNEGQTHRPPIVVDAVPVDHPLSSDLVFHSKNEARIAAALRTQVDFPIKPQSFKDALDLIAAHYQISIVIDERAFEDANIDPTSEVALIPSGITLHDTFHWLFSQMGNPIGYEIRNGALLISTIDRINEDQTIIVYDCRDLIPPETQEPSNESAPSTGGGFFQVASENAQNPGAAAPVSSPSPGPDEKTRAIGRWAGKLVSALRAATPPEEWEGDSNIRPLVYFQGLIVARQDPFTQRRIRRLLAEIRWMRSHGAFAPPGDHGSPTPTSGKQTTTRVTPSGPEQVVIEDEPKSAKSDRTRARKKPNKERLAADNHTKTPLPPVIVEDDRVHPPLSSDVPERSKNEARIADALNAPVDFRFPPRSCKDALDFIAAHYHIPIMIDRRALEDANIDLARRVHVDIPGITLHDLLHWLFAQLGSPLDYEVRDGAIFISTIDKLNEDLSIVVYDCRDLLNPANVGPAGPREQDRGKGARVKSPSGPIAASGPTIAQGHPEAANTRFVRRVTQIQAIIESLDFRPFDAHISDFDGLLVIRLNPLDHERIKRVLASIRWMKKYGAFSGLADEFVDPSSVAAAHSK